MDATELRVLLKDMNEQVEGEEFTVLMEQMDTDHSGSIGLSIFWNFGTKYVVLPDLESLKYWETFTSQLVQISMNSQLLSQDIFVASRKAG